MNKKIISIALVLSMLIGMLAIMPISIGAATTITITSVDDWMEKLSGQTVGEANINVTADVLDFTGKNVKPAFSFKGTFNGNGVVIKNLKMDTSNDSKNECGLFYCPAGDITVENMVITNSSFKGKKWVGAVSCCTGSKTATYNNIFISGSVVIEATDSIAGGIVGGFGSKTETATVSNCVFAGEIITSSTESGGITGKVQSKTTLSISNTLVTGKVSPKGGSCGFVGNNSKIVNLTNCIYAGGGEGDYFNSYPLVNGEGTVNVTNCYTTYADESKGFEGCVYKSDGTPVTYKGFGGSNDNGQVIYLNKSRDTLIGLNCSTTVEGFTKRDGDIMIPNGVANFASTGIFCKFTVTWKNYDGTVLDTDEVLAGETPEYKGEEIPTRPEDTQFIYTFSDEWSPAITAVSGDVTYTAAFDREFTGNDAPADYYDVWYGESRYSYKAFGSGTKEDPYIIRTAEQWANLAEATADGIAEGLYFELAVNLDFNGVEGLKPISPDGKKTLIYFDGNGHTIKGVNMTWSDDGTGLFGEIWGSANLDDNKTSVIKNFYITESVFNGGEYVGALIGEVSGNVIVSNIYVDSSVVVKGSGTEKDEECSVGGIIGGCYYSSSWKPASKVIECTLEVNDCVFAGRVLSSGTKNGGIVGNGNSKKESSQWELFHIVINNSLVTGYVPNDKDRSNGFVGHNDHTCKDSDGNVYTYGDRTEFTASVTLNGCIYAGGAEDVCFYNRPFFGTVTTPTVNNCYTTHTAANGVYNNVKWTSENSGVKLVEIETLMGNGATVPTGWVKRSGDLAIPAGVADFAPTTFTNKLYDGASVRFYNPAGIRFKAIVGDDFLNSFDGEVTFGIIITPTSYIEEAENKFTVKDLDKLSHNVNYVIIQAEKYVDGDGYIIYSGVLGDIKTTNYDRKFSAIAYVAVDGEIVYYSDYNEKVNSRSISEVAEAAYNDTKDSMDDSYKYEIAENSGVYSPYSANSRNSLIGFFGKDKATAVNFMSYNIRNVEGGNHAGTNDLTFEYGGRDQAVVDYILSQKPDVLGVQEASVKSVWTLEGTKVLSWFDTLAQLEAAGYASYRGENVLATYGGNKEMYNPIYYKADKYTLIDCGYEYLGAYTFETSDGTNTDYKGLTWVLLEDEQGIQFVYLNVHMPRKSSSGDHEQDKAAEALMNYIKETFSGYTCPIFIGGDFNGSYSVYQGYKIDGEGDEKVAYWGTTAVKGTTATNKTTGSSEVTNNFTELTGASGAIDLYYVVNSQNVVLHNYAVTDNKVGEKYPSDHLPIKFVVTVFTEKTN